MLGKCGWQLHEVESSLDPLNSKMATAIKLKRDGSSCQHKESYIGRPRNCLSHYHCDTLTGCEWMECQHKESNLGQPNHIRPHSHCAILTSCNWWVGRRSRQQTLCAVTGNRTPIPPVEMDHLAIRPRLRERVCNWWLDSNQRLNSLWDCRSWPRLSYTSGLIVPVLNWLIGTHEKAL